MRLFLIRGIYTEHNIFIHCIAKQRSHKLFCTLKNCPGVAYTGMCQNLKCKNSSLIFALQLENLALLKISAGEKNF